MKSRFLIIISIIVGMAISLPFLIDSSLLLYQESYEDSLRHEIETDFLNKIRETGDDSEPMTFTVISKRDLFNRHENYCGHAHMETEEYWYFADTYNDALLSSSIIQSISSWCEDDNDSCYCELREFIGVDRRSYEDFFRTHMSETCPVIPMPKTATSFDPTKCKWIEDEDPFTWISLPITSCGYPWHESNHEKTKQYYVEYRNVFGNYDSSDPQENAEAMHYVMTRYYEDLGKDILDVRTNVDHSMPKMGEGCHTTVGGTWYLKIQNTDLGYFLDDGYIELENDDIFYDKPLSYWKSLDEDFLVSYYESFGKNNEDFFDTLGALLAKSYFEEKLEDLGIVPTHEIEPGVGGHRSSLPPHIGFGTIVNATDGKIYRLTVSIHGNTIKEGNFEIIKEGTWNKKTDDKSSDSHIIRYSPVLFKGTGVDLEGDKLIALLEEKQEQFHRDFDKLETKGLYPIVGGSFSIGHNAYSLDEKYVGNPIALEIRVLKEEFTKTNLEKINQMVRKHVGDEIDIVYSKGSYVVPSQ